MGSSVEATARIASASGSVTDRRHGLAEIAEKEDVQYIVGDWMSEYNMTMRAGSKVNNKGASSEFEQTFLEAVEPALPWLGSRRIKVVVNAGASDTQKHFLLKDHLDRGVSSSSTYDVLGKNLAEYLRCKQVDIPNCFLERGKI